MQKVTVIELEEKIRQLENGRYTIVCELDEKGLLTPKTIEKILDTDSKVLQAMSSPRLQRRLENIVKKSPIENKQLLDIEIKKVWRLATNIIKNASR